MTNRGLGVAWLRRLRGAWAVLRGRAKAYRPITAAEKREDEAAW